MADGEILAKVVLRIQVLAKMEKRSCMIAG